MKRISKYFKSIIFLISAILILSILLSILNLLGLKSNYSSLLNIIILIILFFIIGFKEGKNSLKKGFLAGIKIGLINIFTLFIINILFFKNNLSINMFIYYILLLLTSILGSMVGINKKKQK